MYMCMSVYVCVYIRIHTIVDACKACTHVMMMIMFMMIMRMMIMMMMMMMMMQV